MLWFAPWLLGGASAFTWFAMTDPANKGGYFQTLPDAAYVLGNQVCAGILLSLSIYSLLALAVSRSIVPIAGFSRFGKHYLLWRSVPLPWLVGVDSAEFNVSLTTHPTRKANKTPLTVARIRSRSRELKVETGLPLAPSWFPVQDGAGPSTEVRIAVHDEREGRGSDGAR